MSKFYEPLKTIVEKDDWKIVEENEHTLACSCNGLNGWAISGMSVVEYSQRRLAFFRDNRLIGEIKLYDLDLAGRVVDEYMTGGFTPTMFISLDIETIYPPSARPVIYLSLCQNRKDSLWL